MICLLIQAALVLPNNLGAYSGIPGFSGPETIVLAMPTHTVTAVVGQRGQAVKSVSQIKNLTKETGPITIRIPNRVRSAAVPAAQKGVLGSVKATWDGQPLAFKVDTRRDNEVFAEDVVSFDGTLSAEATVKSGGTHNLTIEYRNSLASIFAEDLQTFAYDTRFGSNWSAGVSPVQLSVALRYGQLPDGQSAVFAVDSTRPAGWLVGNAIGQGQQGAYFRSDGLPTAATLIFTYYAGGF